MDVAIAAPMLVLGAGHVVMQKRDRLGDEGHRADVPEQNRDGGDHDAPSHDAGGARDHARDVSDVTQ